MKNLILVFGILSILISSCKQDDMFTKTEKMHEKKSEITICDTIFSPYGANLYEFKNFSSDEIKNLPYNEKIKSRQVPDDFLKNMKNNELFLQFIHMDLSSDILLYNTLQLGISNALNNFNVIQELFDRENSHLFFMEYIEKARLRQIQKQDCRFYYYCLTMLAAQNQILRKLNKAETIKFIEIINEKIAEQNKINDGEFWQEISNYAPYMLAFANIMIENKYPNFIHSVKNDTNLSSFIQTAVLKEPEYKLIKIYITEFYNQL